MALDINRTPDKRVILGIVHLAEAGAGFFEDVIRERGYQLELLDATTADLDAVDIRNYAALMVFGGFPQVDQEDVHPWLVGDKALIRRALSSEVPTLGVCLGSQLLADVAGGDVGPAAVERKGWGDVGLTAEAASDPIFANLEATFRTVVWHAYEFALPPAAVPLARSTTALQAFKLIDKPAWGVQFHPEVSPEEMKLWVKWLDELAPEQDHQRHLDEMAIIGQGQLDLSRSICGGFLDVAVDNRV